MKEELKSNTIITDILVKYYQTHDTKDLAALFADYMQEIGAKKLDRRRKDTSNTYQIDGSSTAWNRVECYYYKNNQDYSYYGKFALSISMRKRMGSYILIETGGSDGEIKRIFEASGDKILKYDKEVMKEVVKEYSGLFAKMC